MWVNRTLSFWDYTKLQTLIISLTIAYSLYIHQYNKSFVRRRNVVYNFTKFEFGTKVLLTRMLIQLIRGNVTSIFSDQERMDYGISRKFTLYRESRMGKE